MITNKINLSWGNIGALLFREAVLWNLLWLNLLLIIEIHDLPFIALYIKEAVLAIPKVVGILSLNLQSMLIRTVLPSMMVSSLSFFACKILSLMGSESALAYSR